MLITYDIKIDSELAKQQTKDENYEEALSRVRF